MFWRVMFMPCGVWCGVDGAFFVGNIIVNHIGLGRTPVYEYSYCNDIRFGDCIDRCQTWNSSSGGKSLVFCKSALAVRLTKAKILDV